MYRHSEALDSSKNAEAGSVFAVNNIPDYPRQEVIAVPCDSHSLVKRSAAQISRDGTTSYMLVETGRGGAEELVAKPKGLYAEVGSLRGKPRRSDMADCSSSAVRR